MTNGDLIRPRYGPDVIFQVLEVEVVARIETQATFPGSLCCPEIRGYGLFPSAAVLLGIGGGVELHPVGAAFRSSPDHCRVGIDENGCAYAPAVEFRTYFSQKVFVFQRVPSCIGGDGVNCVRNQGYLIRHHFVHYVDEFRYRVAFNVHFHVEERPDGPHVRIPDMPFVRAGMHGDSLGSEVYAVKGRLLNVRHVPAPGIAKGGELVDIDA